MKNLSLLFSVLFSFSLVIFSSCGDDDSNSGPVGPANASLEGTIWVETSRIATDCPDSSDDENSTCTSECDAILINSGGTVEIAADDGIFSVPYTKNGSNLMIDIGDGNTLDVSYVITGNTMVITFVEDSCNITETYSASQSLALAGTSWEKVGQSNNNCTDPNDNCDPCTLDEQTLQLLAGGTGTSTSPNETQDFTYTTNANMISVSYDDNGTTVTIDIEYKIVGEIMTLEYTEDNGCDVKEIYRGS